MENSRGYDLFLSDRRVSGYRESTLRFHEYVIGKFLRYIKENNLDLTVESTHQHILPFFFHLQQQNLSPLMDVNLADGFVMVHGKGGKDKYVPSARKMVKCLWKYFKTRAAIEDFQTSSLFFTEKENL